MFSLFELLAKSKTHGRSLLLSPQSLAFANLPSSKTVSEANSKTTNLKVKIMEDHSFSKEDREALIASFIRTHTVDDIKNYLHVREDNSKGVYVDHELFIDPNTRRTVFRTFIPEHKFT